VHTHQIRHIRVYLDGYRAEEVTQGDRQAGQDVFHLGWEHLAYHGERYHQEANGAHEDVHHHAHHRHRSIVRHDGALVGQVEVQRHAAHEDRHPNAGDHRRYPPAELSGHAGRQKTRNEAGDADQNSSEITIYPGTRLVHYLDGVVYDHEDPGELLEEEEAEHHGERHNGVALYQVPQ